MVQAIDAGKRVRGFLVDHSASLIGLFSTSFLLNLANFAVSTLLVVKTSGSLFGTYLVGQSVVLLSYSLSDGGLSTAARIIASQEHPDALLIATLQRILNRYSLLLAALALGVCSVLAGAFSRFDQTRGVHVPTQYMLLCAVIGIVQARQILYSSLIYSGGRFRSYSTALLVPVTLRLAVVSGMMISGVHLTLPILLANDLGSSLAGLLYGSFWLRRLRSNAGTSIPSQNAPMLSRQVHHLLRSGMIPTFLEAVALQSVVLSGGAFGTGVAVATFGVFVRAIQIIKVVLDPLITYGERRLRLAAPAQRGRAEFSLLALVIGSYMLLASCILVVYLTASAFFHHYALGHTPELLFSLATTMLAFTYLCLDSILLSRGHAKFRLTGTVLQVVMALLMVTILHPASLWQLVILNSTIAVPRLIYYSWFYLRRISDRSDWSLWVPETADAVSSGETTL